MWPVRQGGSNHSVEALGRKRSSGLRGLERPPIVLGRFKVYPDESI
jgi:hypothetical protein